MLQSRNFFCKLTQSVRKIGKKLYDFEKYFLLRIPDSYSALIDKSKVDMEKEEAMLVVTNIETMKMEVISNIEKLRKMGRINKCSW